MRRPFVILLSTLVTIAIVEAGARVYFHAFLKRHLATLQEHMEAPPAVRSAPYYTPQFVSEQNEVRLVGRDRGYFILADATGEYINVEGGLRRTTNQPAVPDRRILLFGGSTIQSDQVPDDETIPSHLQHLINEQCSASVAVFNYGVGSMDLRQLAVRLRDTSIAPGDLVVFYSGVNTIYYPLYSGGWFSGPPASRPLLEAVLDRAAPFSAAAMVVADVRARAAPRTIADAGRLQRGLDRVERQYRTEVLTAHRFAADRGAGFVNFLQPQLFATPLSTDERHALARNYLSTPAGLDVAYREGYPRLRRALAAAAHEGVESHDISTILASDEVPAEVFLDFAHINHTGNALVANAMFARLAGHIGNCTSPDM